ncbi:FAD-dependent oxidoreductase [Brevibacterium otitidis]|uniref:FAD-dependent oxidoreductase n=1 Tax=Brevibacterium otitidis TaxID=53364 RepID=A0ABV5X2B3_9MICO|nr:N-methyl-L-tryptophan oxidase [Brevibacterium otitidis]
MIHAETTQNSRRVAVIGAGVIGTMTAWQLAKRGHQVTVFDQFNTPNDRGASAGESRIFRTLYKEGTDYLPILASVREFWEELQHEQRPFLEMCGGLTIGHPEQPDVARVIECGEVGGLDFEVIDAADMARRYPQYRLDDDEVGVFDPASGIFRPELAVLSARDESIKYGARYRPYSRVLGIRPLSNAVVLDSADGAAEFDNVVLATGPWCNELSGLPHSTVVPRRLVALWFAAADVPLHTPTNMPISIRRHAAGGFSCFPVVDGVGVKILPHHLPWVDLDTVDELPRFIETEFVRSAESAVARLMPGLEPTAFRVSTWAEGFAADDAPIIGTSPEDGRIVYAFGMSGQGFKFSPMVGSIAADLVSEGRSPDMIDIFDAARLVNDSAPSNAAHAVGSAP